MMKKYYLKARSIRSAVKFTTFSSLFLFLWFLSNLLSFENGGFPNVLSQSGYFVKQCGCWKHFGKLRSKLTPNILSSCSEEATFHGTHQNIISYSLYNFNQEGEKYSLGILPNLYSMRKIYPGWIMRLYTDYPLIKGSKYCQMVCDSDDLFWCDARDIPQLGNLSSYNGMTWRFLPIGDPLVDIFISRDLDSQLTFKEKAAVSQWLDSDKTFHFMRNHVHHLAHVLGGMWGAKVSQLNSKEAYKLQHEFIKRGRIKLMGWDQWILKQVLYVPEYFPKIIAHDSNYCNVFYKTLCLPFPTQGENSKDFVGKISNSQYE